VTAYLTRFKGSSREHSESDLRCYLTWCADHGLDPQPESLDACANSRLLGRGSCGLIG
jgi:hypothetical protein